MVNKTTIIVAAAVLGLSLIFAPGCESDAQTGALVGAAIGAGVGQAVGGDTSATLIGAGVGAAGGYMIGNEQDKKKARTEGVQGLDVVTVNVVNSNGSTTPVRLKKQGAGYTGPRGEYYDHLPSPNELKSVYGF